MIGAYPYGNNTMHAGIYSFTGLPHPDKPTTSQHQQQRYQEEQHRHIRRQHRQLTQKQQQQQKQQSWVQGRDYCSSSDHPDDCAAMVDLGVTTDSHHWAYSTNWLTNKSICDWELIGCNGDGRVKILALSFNNMVGGPLPPSMSKLTQLEDLDFEGNHISGPLAADLATGLTSLVEVGLGGNNFSGVLPVTLCELQALQGPACDLSGNNWSCPLPECAAVRCGAVCNP